MVPVPLAAGAGYVPGVRALASLALFGAVRHRNFRLFITGQFVSLCGTWMQNVALGWLVLQLTDSAFAVGLVGAMGALPVLLFTLHGGAFATRVDRLRWMTLLQGLMLLQAAALAAVTWTGHATLGWLVALALAGGLLSAYEIPMRQTFLMDLVGRDDLMNAIAMNSMAFNVSRVVGPMLAGILTAAFSAAVSFSVNAVSYLAVLAGLLLIRLDPAHVVPSAEPPPLSAALRYVARSVWPRTLVSLTAVYTVFAISFLTVLPVYARDVLGTGAAGYGALTAAFGLGAAAGALGLAGLGGRRGRGPLAVRAGLVVGLTLGVLALVPNLHLAYLMMFLGGGAMAINAITTNTLLQTEAPPELRGRVIGFYAFIVVGLAPLGALQAGWVSQHLGVRMDAALGGALCLLATLAMSSRLRSRGGDRE